MKLTCLINSHNYAAYIGEAIDSALAQTRPFNEIIIVDDGSVDGTVDLVQRRYGDIPSVKLIAKAQAGQLSCFHRGLQSTTGDVVFFLDADDRFGSNMLERASQVYRDRGDVDFLSVGFTEFGNSHQQRRLQAKTRDRGLSVAGVVFSNLWVGNPTSCLSMRTELLQRVLPYPKESEWITRADDVLVFGASLVGGHKFHLEESLVDYRIHESNHHAGKKPNRSQKLQYALRVHRLIEWFVEDQGYERSKLGYLLSREFRTLDSPTWREFRQYCRMAGKASLPARERAEQFITMLVHYVQESRRCRQMGHDADTIALPQRPVPTAGTHTKAA